VDRDDTIPTSGTLSHCYRNPETDVAFLIFDVYQDNGDNVWYPIRLSGITRAQMAALALATLAFIVAPALLATRETHNE